MNVKSLYCTAAFEPGPSPEEMAYIAQACPGSNAEVTNMRLEEARDGKLRIAMEVNGRDLDVEIPKEISVPVRPSTRPQGFAFNTARITLKRRFVRQKEIIDARLAKMGITPNWETEELSRKLGGIYIHHSNEPKNYRDYQGEHYSFYTIGKGPDAILIGLLRRWLPARDKRPTYDGLLKALRERYGTETRIITTKRAGRTYTLGLQWSFDRSGAQLEKACGGARSLWHKLRRLPGHSDGLLTLDLAAPWHNGCGVQFYLNHSAPETMNQLQALQAVLIDSAPIEHLLWKQFSGDVAARIESAREDGAKEAAEREQKDSVDPDL